MRPIDADALEYEELLDMETGLIHGVVTEEEIEAAPTLGPVLEWHPVKFREMTEEERAELEDIGIDTTARTITESTMPEDGQEVLVTLRDGRMYYDTAYNDNLGHYLGSGIDWEEDVIAWAAPEPYKPEKEGGSEDGLPV